MMVTTYTGNLRAARPVLGRRPGTQRSGGDGVRAAPARRPPPGLRQAGAPGVLLRVVAHGEQLLLAEGGVVVKAQLGVGRHHLAVVGLRQRVHLRARAPGTRRTALALAVPGSRRLLRFHGAWPCPEPCSRSQLHAG